MNDISAKEAALAHAYALLRAASASDQATYDWAYQQAKDRLLRLFPDDLALVADTLIAYSTHLGRASPTLMPPRS